MLFLFKHSKNHVLLVNYKVKILKQKGRITVLCCKISFMQYGEEDSISQKIAMLQLYLNGFANQKQIAQGFGVHPKSKKRFSICDFEKKRFFDLVKIVACNIEQEMTKTFSSYYTRKNCYQVMRMIPERTTEVKLISNDTL